MLHRLRDCSFIFLALIAILTAIVPATAKPVTFVALPATQNLLLPHTGRMINSNLRPLQQSASMHDILIDEDFSGFDSGSETEPGSEIVCRFAVGAETVIPDNYTSVPGWTGSEIYPAGGCIAMIPHSKEGHAILNTPYGDYSGDVKVTFKARNLHDDNDTKSIILCKFYTGGYYDGEIASGDGVETSFNLYGSTDKGWREFEMTLTNKSSDNDGFFQIAVNGDGALIDDLKITSSPSYLAAPQLLPPTGFAETGFTVNWQPVRAAFDYWVYLYKKEAIGTDNEDIDVDFNQLNIYGSNLPENWIFSLTDKIKLTPEEGRNGTRALLLKNGDYVETYYNYALYEKMSLWWKAIYPDEMLAEIDDDSYLSIEAYDGQNWRSIIPGRNNILLSSLYSENGKMINMDEIYENQFSNRYYKVRFILHTPHPEVSLALDDFTIVTGPPYTLIPVKMPNYGQFDITKDTHYDIKDLEPEGDYYYRVESHYVLQRTSSPLAHALGVSMPTVVETTDVDFENGSFTVNWNKVTKATSYTVSLFGVERISEDIDDYTLMKETFNKITSDIAESDDIMMPTPFENYAFASFDGLTDINGWTGIENAMCTGMLGADMFNYMNIPVLITPPVYLGNNDTYNLTATIHGEPGDILELISVDNTTYRLEFKYNPDTDYGHIKGTVKLPVTADMEELFIVSSGMMGFLIDDIEFSQNLKKGDIVYKFLTSAEIDPNTLHYTFNNLNDTGFSEWAFILKSNYVNGDDQAVSDPTTFIVIGNPTTSTNILDSDTTPKTITAYYSIDGKKSETPFKGINILKYSDGSVKKVIIR